MVRSKKSNTGAVYISNRLKEQMSMVLEYPCTIVEAPMGYGKTTAVRECLKSTDAQVLWQKLYDSSVAGFWSGFCRLFGELDLKCAESLAGIGFPNDSASREAVLRFLQEIKLFSEIIIVLDDYHLIDSPAVNEFIEYLLWNELSSIHIVITARFTRFSNLDELMLKGYLHHVTKESLELDPKDIIAYFKLCGIILKENDGDRLYEYSEGWISALYLIMLNFKSEGSFETAPSITRLLEKTVYIPFSDEIKEFLLNICFLESFTLEQAAHIWQKNNAEKLLNEIKSKNAFISYDEKSKAYQMHKIFSGYLLEIFENKKPEYKNHLYGMAAGWYMKTGDFMAAMKYYYKARDFDCLLVALEVDKGHSLHNEHRAVFVSCFNECPVNIRRRHPIVLLVYALCLFSFNEFELFDRACGEFAAAIQENDSLDINDINRLMGEFELLLSFTGYNDIKKMYFHIKNSYELLKGPAKFIDTKGCWTFGSPSVLYMFHRQTGDLDNELLSMKEAMPLYNLLANGHGKGGEYVMEAEAFFNRVDLDSAEILAHKALYNASSHGQEDIVLCAVFLQARIAVMKNDYAYAAYSLRKLREEIEQKNSYNLIHTFELCEAFINAGFQQDKGIPEWIAGGDFNSSRLYFPAMAFLNIVYGRVLLIKGEYLKLLGIAGQFVETASVFPNLIGQIYTYIHIAAANERILRYDAAMEALRQALDIAMLDKLYMPFVENCDYIMPLLEELQREGSYSSDITWILELYAPYRSTVRQIVKEYFVQDRPELTEREQEISRLVAEGMSNIEIASMLYISQNTVKTMLKRVFEKLGISSRTMLKQYFDTQV